VTTGAKEPCGNDDCDRCDPRPRWKISEHRVQHVTYQREIKAATREEALQLFEAGTAWPSSYDDSYGEIVQQDAAVVEQVTDERELRYYREENCYHDLPSKLKAAGLGHLAAIDTETHDGCAPCTPTPVEEFSQEFVDALLAED
jgi:hypothetical protein